MTLTVGLALYFIIWWLTLFAVLPFGVKTQAEAGDVVPGTPASAPSRQRMVRIFALNSVVALVVFAGVWYALEAGWILPPPPPPPAI
jgi:predicted secreted protein